MEAGVLEREPCELTDGERGGRCNADSDGCWGPDEDVAGEPTLLLLALTAPVDVLELSEFNSSAPGFNSCNERK